MAALDNERVDRIYEKITERKASRGEWNIERRNFAQKIVYVDDACRVVLSAIANIENATPGSDMKELERVLRTEFKFFDTVQK
jgi:hypothetical protein